MIEVELVIPGAIIAVLVVVATILWEKTRRLEEAAQTLQRQKERLSKLNAELVAPQIKDAPRLGTDPSQSYPQAESFRK